MKTLQERMEDLQTSVDNLDTKLNAFMEVIQASKENPLPNELLDNLVTTIKTGLSDQIRQGLLQDFNTVSIQNIESILRNKQL